MFLVSIDDGAGIHKTTFTIGWYRFMLIDNPKFVKEFMTEQSGVRAFQTRAEGCRKDELSVISRIF